jgi:hypothetical protein
VSRMTSPTPTRTGGLRPVTLTLRGGRDNGPVGECAVRLVLTSPDTDPTPGAWAITHTLGSPAGGTHTEVVFTDEAPDAPLPVTERVLDDVVRQVADLLYARSWAFHYRPDQVAGSVLRHGSILRERVEVSAVEVWS